MQDARARLGEPLLCLPPVLNMVCEFAPFVSLCVCTEFGFCMSFRDQFLTASISYCQHCCLWHSFSSRKTGSREGCLALLSQRLQLTWPWMYIDVLVCFVWVYVCGWCVCRSSVSHLGVSNSKRHQLLNRFSLKDSVSDISLTVYPFLFLFSDLLLALYNCDWGCEPVSSHSWSRNGSRSLYAVPALHKTCYIWHSVFIGVCPHSAYSFTPSSPHPFSLSLPRQLPSSTFTLPLPTPSFLCLLLLPWFTFSANFYPFFVKLLSLTLLTVSAWLQKWGLWRVKQRREKRGGGNHVDQQLSSKYNFHWLQGCGAFLELNTVMNVVELWFTMHLLQATAALLLNNMSLKKMHGIKVCSFSPNDVCQRWLECVNKLSSNNKFVLLLSYHHSHQEHFAKLVYYYKLGFSSNISLNK